jgi:hypothetical protein
VGVLFNAGFIALAVTGAVKLGLLTNSISVLAAAPPLAGSIYLWRVVGAGHAYIHLINAYSRDRPSFWRRTRDDWAVAIVTGVISLIIGFVLGKISE